MSKARGKAKKFQTEWTLKYGVEVSTRTPSTSEVSSVLCMFCRHFGREDGQRFEMVQSEPSKAVATLLGKETSL